MRRLLVIAVVLVSLVGFVPPAEAHPTTRFTGCAAITANGRRCFEDGLSYHYTMTVRLRGKVVPAHAGRAEVWRKHPNRQRWVRIGSTPVNSRGVIRWNWQTRRVDAVQNKPYRFQFRIPRHGRSNVITVWVLFGE